MATACMQQPQQKKLYERRTGKSWTRGIMIPYARVGAPIDYVEQPGKQQKKDLRSLLFSHRTLLDSYYPRERVDAICRNREDCDILGALMYIAVLDPAVKEDVLDVMGDLLQGAAVEILLRGINVAILLNDLNLTRYLIRHCDHLDLLKPYYRTFILFAEEKKHAAIVDFLKQLE